MKPEVKRKLDDIFSYPLFQSVGKPIEGPVTKVDNWPLAVEVCNKKRKWENCRLMAKNALQRFAYQRDWNRAQEWNPLVQELHPLIDRFIETLFTNPIIPTHVLKKVEADLRWDFLGMCVEYSYRDLV